MSGIISVIERQFSVFVGFVLVVLTALLYQHALHSGFFLDDSTSIRVEPLMLQSEILPLYEKFKLRFLGYLSFWANYQISGDVVCSAPMCRQGCPKEFGVPTIVATNATN